MDGGERMTAAERLASQLAELQKGLRHARGNLARSQANVRSGYKGAQQEELEDFACIRELQAKISELEPRYLELRNRERDRRNTRAEADRARREQAQQDIRDRQQQLWRAEDSVGKVEEAKKQLAELKTRALTAVSQLPKAEQKQYRVRLSELG
jgi:hypothetical protein